MPPFVNLALAQLKPRKADYQENLRRLRAVFARIDQLEPRPNVLCLAESALTGYFLEGGVRDNAVTAGTLAADLDEAYRAAVPSPRPLDVTLGFYEIWNNKLYNSSAYVTLGEGVPRIAHVHRKVFLPTYGLFDEERFVERGRDVRAFDTSWGRAAMLVCEDAWHSMTATICALDGAQIVFVCAAPPARGAWPKDDDVPGPASVSRWDRLVRDIADEHGLFVTLTTLVGSEGGKTFPGGSLVAGPRGDVRGRAPLWEDAVLSVSVDLSDVTRARADMPLIADLEVMIPHLRASLDDAMAGTPAVVAFDPPPLGPSRPAPSEQTSTPGDDGIRVVRMPGEIPEQPLGLVAGTKRQSLVFGREIEQRDHSHSRHHVTTACRIGIGLVAQVAVDGGADVDGSALDPERVDHELGVLEALLARRAIRHPNAEHVSGAERLGGQIRGNR